MKNALVVSGGGSKGAFAVGAVERLREEGVEFDIVAGTSTGALMGPLVITDEIQALRGIYTNIHDEDILKKRNIIEIATQDAIYDTTPLWELINSFMTEERYQKILASPKELFLTTVNLQTGGVENWNPHNSGENGGSMSLRAVNRAIFASASQPVLMPAIEIEEGGHQYVDGGVRDVAPLKIAIDKGATHIYAIVLSPESHEPNDKTYRFVVTTLLRAIDLFVKEVVKNDVSKAVLYNQAIVHFEKLRQKAAAILSPEQVDAIFADSENPNPFGDKKVLELSLIRPKEELPIDSLKFNPVSMARIMEMGRQAAEELLQQSPVVT